MKLPSLLVTLCLLLASCRAAQYPSPDALAIVDANYATTNVKNNITKLLTWSDWNPTSLNLDTSKLNNYFGDPWYGTWKTASVLFRYVYDDPKILVTRERSGVSVVSHDASASFSKIFTLPNVPVSPSNLKFQILAVVWGQLVINDGAAYQRMYGAFSQNKSFAATNMAMGTDGWYGTAKTAQLYYLIKDPSRSNRIGSITAQENGVLIPPSL